jgi:hypothetical protein
MRLVGVHNHRDHLSLPDWTTRKFTKAADATEA